MTRRLCIFAHFNARPTVAPYVLYHLERLRVDCDRLVLASNSPVSGPARQAVEDCVDRILERPNTGFDFAAWRDALAGEDMTGWDEVLLVNSSMIGPLRPLAPVLDEMRGRDCDFWGLAENDEVRRHLMSFFLCFKAPVIRSDAWRGFWTSVRDETNKKTLIHDYEIRLTDYFERNGFKSVAYMKRPVFEEHERYTWMRRASFIPKWRKIDRNQADVTMFAAPELVRAGMPYFKASLIWGSKGRRRPRAIREIKALPGLEYDWSLLSRR